VLKKLPPGVLADETAPVTKEQWEYLLTRRCLMIENVKCPECNGPMISRKNNSNGQRFWGCKDYPQCKGTRNTDGEAPRKWTPDTNEDSSEDGMPSDRQRRNDHTRWRG